MYLNYFGLSEKPFAITPDPAFLYLSERHAEALAHLVYGVTISDGFIQLTGEVGTGKTTLTRRLLDELPDDVDVALILNPAVSVQELLEAMFREFDWDTPVGTDRHHSQTQAYVDSLNEHLLEAHTEGRRVVLMIDEAQNLDVSVLEQLRLLTNLETHKQKLLQIVLVGQPELRELLGRQGLRQLAQRVTARYHLTELDQQEAAGYIQHRLKTAGAERPIFTASAINEIHRRSRGVPRLINVICDRALLGAFTQENAVVNKVIARRAADQVFGINLAPQQRQIRRWQIAAVSVAVVGLAIATFYSVSNKQLEPAVLELASTPISKPLVEIPASHQSPVTTPNDHPTETNTANPLFVRSDIHQFLSSEQSYTGTDSALTTLFSVWQTGYQPQTNNNACNHAENTGLRCEYITASWPLLSLLNRPAVLTLIDSRGQTHHVTMTALNEQRVT
ncbi:MAG: AAA family ATPase, partial [Gammaproteobacteria bacterium]|nr:AAA family ATPase [Gammaproteobacteria bacterium]